MEYLSIVFGILIAVQGIQCLNLAAEYRKLSNIFGDNEADSIPYVSSSYAMSAIETAFRLAEQCYTDKMPDCAGKVRVFLMKNIAMRVTYDYFNKPRICPEVNMILDYIKNELSSLQPSEVSAFDVKKLWDETHRSYKIDCTRAVTDLFSALPKHEVYHAEDFREPPEERYCFRNPIDRLDMKLQVIHAMLTHCVDSKTCDIKGYKEIRNAFVEYGVEIKEKKCSDPFMMTVLSRVVHKLKQLNPNDGYVMPVIDHFRRQINFEPAHGFWNTVYQKIAFDISETPTTECYYKSLLDLREQFESIYDINKPNQDITGALEMLQKLYEKEERKMLFGGCNKKPYNDHIELMQKTLSLDGDVLRQLTTHFINGILLPHNISHLHIFCEELARVFPEERDGKNDYINDCNRPIVRDLISILLNADLLSQISATRQTDDELRPKINLRKILVSEALRIISRCPQTRINLIIFQIMMQLQKQPCKVAASAFILQEKVVNGEITVPLY